MEINYITENPRAVLRQEHAATMRVQLEETLGTFSGYFFVTLFLNEAVQRGTVEYVTRSTFFNGVRFWLYFSLLWNKEKRRQIISTSTASLCHQQFARTETVLVLFSTHN